MAALVKRGEVVRGAKIGPDFIDPTYHHLATSLPAYNLDPFLTGGASGVRRSLERASRGASVLVVEGVMGLFDGTYLTPPSVNTDPEQPSPTIPYASTAHVAVLSGLPVVLVLDASAASSTIAAIAHGLSTYSRKIDVCGIIVNRVASPTHQRMISKALEPLEAPVLGYLPRVQDASLPSRHLGLIPALEHQLNALERIEILAEMMETYIDLDLLQKLANVSQTPSPPALPIPSSTRKVALASGKAFTFFYQENLDLLLEHGAEILPFDPTSDEALPPSTEVLILGGGFPEVYLEEIGRNCGILSSIRDFARNGGRIWAECAGHLLLNRILDDQKLCAVLPGHGTMTKKLKLGYRKVIATTDNPLFAASEEVGAHEFHYSQLNGEQDELQIEGFGGITHGGTSRAEMLSSYLHFHLAGLPGAPARLLS